MNVTQSVSAIARLRRLLLTSLAWSIRDATATDIGYPQVSRSCLYAFSASSGVPSFSAPWNSSMAPTSASSSPPSESSPMSSSGLSMSPDFLDDLGGPTRTAMSWPFILELLGRELVVDDVRRGDVGVDPAGCQDALERGVSRVGARLALHQVGVGVTERRGAGAHDHRAQEAHAARLVDPIERQVVAARRGVLDRRRQLAHLRQDCARR